MHDPPQPELPTRTFVLLLVVLGVVSLGMQLWLRGHPWIGWGTLGDDAQFWMARATTVFSSPLAGSHPPMYPLLTAIVGIPLPLLAAGGLVSGLAAALLAPLAGLTVALTAGRRAGIAAGVLTLGLPHLQLAGLLSEATALFVLGLAAVTAVAAALVRSPSPVRALALGASVGLLCATKEQGLAWIPAFVVLPALIVPRRWSLVGLVALGIALVLLPLVAANVTSGSGLLGKVLLPFQDVWAWFAIGKVPPPLMPRMPGDLPLDASLDGAAPWTLLHAELARFVGFAGPWVFLVPLGLLGPVLAWRRKRLSTAQLGLYLLPMSGLVVVIAVPVLERHVEAALLPVAWGVATLAVQLRGRRLALAAVLALGVVVGNGLDVAPMALARLKWSGEANLVHTREAEAVLAVLPAGAALCASEGWAVAFIERAERCGPVLQPRTVWLVGRRRLLACFDAVPEAAIPVPSEVTPPDQYLLPVETQARHTALGVGACGSTTLRAHEPLGMVRR